MVLSIQSIEYELKISDTYKKRSNIFYIEYCINTQIEIDKKRTKSDFLRTQQKLTQRSTDWKARIPCNVGKVVLDKSNLICIPQYFMNWFKISKLICEEIDKTKENFF